MKKQENNDKLASLIPLGMFFGSLIGMITSMISQPTLSISFISTRLTMGAGFGLLIGCVTYAILSYNGNES